jgi:hypothetical protein
MKNQKSRALKPFSSLNNSYYHNIDYKIVKQDKKKSPL